MTRHLATLILALLVVSSTHAGDPMPDPATKVEITIKKGKKAPPGGEAEFYQKITWDDCVLEALPWEGAPEGGEKQNLLLRIIKPGGFQFMNRSYRFGVGRKTIDPMPAEFVGKTGLTAMLEKNDEQVLRFKSSQPVRVYAYIRWWWDNQPNTELPLWKPYSRDHSAQSTLYYRDFPAGISTINLLGDHFTGVAIIPKAKLSDTEKLVVSQHWQNDLPYLRVVNEYGEPKSVAWHYEINDPGTGTQLAKGSQSLDLPPGETLVPIPITELPEGAMTFIENTLKLGDLTWERTVPYGRFPVPPPDESVADPIFPYGGYIHLPINDDPDVYDQFLAATFYKFRLMKMNVAVLKKESKERLDLAQKYHLKAIIRLSGRDVDLPDDIINHPTVLTYMVGDEPALGPEFDRYLEEYKLLTTAYPQYEPITCTIYDGYGTGMNNDPVLIHHALKEFKFTRFGRYYCFRKDNYGLLWPAEYKGMLPIEAVFQGLESNHEKTWWLAPPYFGKEPALYKPETYWRIPTGTELSGLTHLALAHRCGAIIGWGTHTHSNITSVFFDGATMTETKYSVAKDMAKLGEELMTARSVLQSFTPERLQLFWKTPVEVDATARWLKNGMFAAYAVNMDVTEPHAAMLKIYLGPTTVSKRTPISGDGWYDEIDAIVDVFSGEAVPFHKEETVVDIDMGNGETRQNTKVYLVIDTPEIAPGKAMLLVARSKAENGAFTAVADALKKNLDDAADINVDF